jgi:hypothetical protein
LLFELRSDHKPLPRPEPDDPAPSHRMTIAALVVIVLLLAIGLFLVHVLRASSALEDCLMQGRTNCAPIPTKGQ